MNRLALLDYGRLAAALSVLLFHYFFNGIGNGKIASLHEVPEIASIARYGYLGVQFFFMLSGYVIFFSARQRSASQFAVSRLVRLYPAYWMAVLVTAAFAAFFGGDQMRVTMTQVAANLTMFAPWLGQPFVDGVYWTLQLEMMFYAAVLVLLLCGQQKRLSTIALAWPLLILAALVAGRTYLPFAGQYYCFFAGGTVLAVVKQRRDIRTLASLALCLWLCLEFACGESAALSQQKGVAFSPLVIGAAVVTMFAFFALLNSPRGATLQLPGARLAGALTYPLYLLHAHIGYMLLSRFGTDANMALIYAGTILVVFALAYAIHVLVERRLATQWHRLFSALLTHPLDWLQQRLSRGAWHRPEAIQAPRARRDG